MSAAGKIRIPNETDLPITIKRHHHFAQVSRVFQLDITVTLEPSLIKVSALKQSSSVSVPHSSAISIDPDGILPVGCAQQVRSFISFTKNLVMYLIPLSGATTVLWIQSLQRLTWVLFFLLKERVFFPNTVDPRY